MKLCPDIILVEDSDPDRLLYSKYITQAGCGCISFDSGESFVAQLHTFKPSLVLLDIEMPGQNGFETIRRIQDHLSAVDSQHVVVAVTSHSEKDVLDQIVSAGFDDCLLKPFTKKEMERVINKYVNLEKPGSDEICSPVRIHDNNGKCYSLSMFDGEDPEFVKSIVEMFVNNTPASIDLLDKAFAENNMELLRQTAHKLKPHYSFFGVDTIYQALQQIENISAGQPGKQSIPALLECVRSRSSLIIEQMRNDLLS